MPQRTILLPTVGSAGDVHPVIALGMGLRERGNRPIIVANDFFKPMVEQNGLEFLSLGTADDYRKMVDHPDLWHPTRGFQVLVEHAIAPYVRPLFDLISQFDPAGTIVAASGFLYGAAIAHEKLGTPYITLHLQPALFRTAYDTPAMGGFFFPEWLPRWFKRGYFKFLDAALVDRAIGPHVNPVRREVGLPPQAHFFGNSFHAPQKSIGLFPDWFAPPQPDWPPQIQLTGFIQFDSGLHRGLPPALANFLADGEAPLVFTPGTAMRRGEWFFRASIEAARSLGKRAILLSQHREHIPEKLPEGICHFDYAPFSQLLPRAAALIYHGGIGTMAQALAAGIPHLVMPMSHDQPDNARRLERLGVGATLSPAQYNSRNVADRLSRLLASAGVKERCQELSQLVDFEQALDETCASIETAA